MKKLLILMALLFLVVGCGKSEEISKKQLVDLTSTWKEPKVAIWYYEGSDENFHYITHRDLGIHKNYKIAKSELVIENEFNRTEEERQWRTMPWGPLQYNKEKY